MNRPERKNRATWFLCVSILLCLLFPLLLGTCAAQAVNAKPSAEAGVKAEWEVTSIFGDELFPSYIVTVAMLNSAEEIDSKTSPDVLGAPYGVILVRVKSPQDNSTVRIELSSTKFIRKSVFEGILKKGNIDYEIYPFVKYDYDALLAVRQPVPEDLSVTVWLNGASLGEKTVTMRVRSINECVFELMNGDKSEDVSWTFAAYVNENHPFIDNVLKNALVKDVSSFSGYLGDRKSVLAEIEALWNAVQKRGMKYSNISAPVAESDGVACQHVRLLGDSITYGQANCVDGTVLFASLLRKIGLSTYLMLSSDHAFLGVDLAENGKDRVYIETTMVGDSTLEEALEAGRENVKEYKAKKDLTIVDINKWRDRGILPLKDIKAEK
jgi:hypothetical protein